MPRLAVLSLIPLLLLTSCASLSEEECLRGDWRGIGYEDGVDGRERDFILRHAKACAEVGVSPDREAWLAGRAEGLPLYCTIDNAYDEGRRGVVLNNVCPPAQYARLRAANRQGLRYRAVLDDIDDAEDRQRAIRAQLAELPSDNPIRGALRAEYSSLQSKIMFLRLERLRLRR
ncbi:Protein of unknown function [Tranquillimonas rosea]|uniref:DUF2799 domain-containing protein n=1 Tax=Tranquillimonas rosea TaxID=641238 RepID=A0A1H9TB98_9RHOB|nr:DUF2799 domain-containing protein [Tranquillimonas rosea]SER94386.1 Protein of unknown function [Tranquillimonas rosea]